MGLNILLINNFYKMQSTYLDSILIKIKTHLAG